MKYKYNASINTRVFFLLLWLYIFGCPGLNAQEAGKKREFRDPFANQIPKPKIEEPPKEIIAAPIAPEVIITPPQLTIESLIAGGPEPQIIINGRILRVGSQIEEAMITKVTKEGAEFIYKKQTFKIPAPSRHLFPIHRGGENAEFK